MSSNREGCPGDPDRSPPGGHGMKNKKFCGAWSVIPFLCLCSGCFSLVYQVVWIRLFSLSLGSTLIALSLVSACFFCGLALGSYWGGYAGGKLKHPLKLYGALEIFIAALAFLVPYARTVLEDAVHTPFALRAGAALIMFAAAVPMGCILPVLSPYFAQRGEGRLLSYMYGINTLGACIGSLAAGFWGIRVLGVFLTNSLTATLNLIVGAGALLMAERLGRVTFPVVQSGTASAPFPAGAGAAAFLSGVTFMAWEVFFVRYLGFYFRDTAFLYAGIITVLIFASGAGDIVFGGLLKKCSPGRLFVGGNVTASLVGVFFIIGALFCYPHIVALEHSPAAQFVLIGVFVGLPVFLASVNMPVLFQYISRAGNIPGAAGKLFCCNTLGAVCGALLFPLYVFPAFGMTAALWGMLALVSGMTAYACDLWRRGGSSGLRRAVRGVGVAALALVPAVLAEDMPDITKLALKEKLRAELGSWSAEASISEIREGPYGTSWVALLPGGERLLFSERVIISRDRSASFRTEGFLPILIGERLPRNVLSLCFGGGLSTVAAGLLPQVESFVMVDISRDNMELALKYFADNERWKTDERAEFRVEDAFRFLKESGKRFDLILAEPTPPYFGYRGAAFYTRDFFLAVARRLAPGGIFSMTLPCGQLTSEETRNVMKSFSAAFPHCCLWWNGVDPLMVGSLDVVKPQSGRFEELGRVQGFLPELARISGSAALHEQASFPAALLLVDEDFRAFCQRGETYDLDRPALEFCGGEALTCRNIVEIFQSLSSAKAVREAVGQGMMPDLYWEKEFELRRRRLINISVRMAGIIH